MWAVLKAEAPMFWLGVCRTAATAGFTDSVIEALDMSLMSLAVGDDPNSWRLANDLPTCSTLHYSALYHSSYQRLRAMVSLPSFGAGITFTRSKATRYRLA
jgi:hypothetical protein